MSPSARRGTWRIALALLGVAVLAATGIVGWRWAGPQTGGGGVTTPTPGRTGRTGREVGSPGAPRWPSAAPGGYRLPNPRRRMLLGAYVSLSGLSTETAIARREAAMGRRYNLELTYYNWRDPFPDSGEATIKAHGRTPVMAWYGPGKSRDSPNKLGQINDGQDDAWIRQQAEAIKRFGKPIFLRLMPEMNGDWYGGFSGRPAAFIAAWRRIHRIFDQVGASNVVWVWCPNATPHDWDRYYPGNSYVDLIGVDGFSSVRWGLRSFRQIFGQFLAHFAGRKPLMIVETAADSGAAAFISGMRHYLQDVAGPRYGVVAVCWFDTDTSGPGNWRVDQTPASWRAWLSLAHDPYFGGHGPPGDQTAR